jgi:hypothetical protein
MLRVVLVSGGGVHPAQHHGVDRQPLALEPAEDLPDQPAPDRVGLDEDKGALGGGHCGSFWAGGCSAPPA